MKKTAIRLCKLITVVAVCLNLGGCDDPHIYGSVGVSSYGGGGYYGSPRVGGSITIGGRIR